VSFDIVVLRWKRIKKYRLRMFENNVLRRIFGLKRNEVIVGLRNYREDFKSVDKVIALCSTATGALPAVRHMRILPMNQPITFGMK
jgi:hypothetical protein